MIEIKNKKILLLGLGLHGGGVATARWLHKNGAKLVISDLKKKSVLSHSIEKLAKHKSIKYVLGKHKERDVKWADYIVYNPGVPKESKYLQLARRLNKPVYNEASLFFDRCKAQIIAVTGTRGKSTTSALIASMCEKKNKRTILAGNIKTSFMLDVVDRATKNDLVVLELSSWQLEGLNIVRGTPHVAVVTNLYPDHLNRYRNLTNYYCSKKEIFKHQDEDRFIILNDEDNIVRDWQKEACSRTFLFSKKNHKGHGAYVQNNKIKFALENKREVIASVKDIKLEGMHNLENVLAAITAAKIYGVANSQIKKALNTELILEGRQEVISVKRGITFVNDTTATTPVAGIAALQRFGNKKKNIILIAGGADKKLDYYDWSKEVKKYCKQVFLLKGDASIKQEKALKKFRNLDTNHTSMSVIAEKALEQAKKGNIILLSPAAASFNLWQHEFERGDDFVKAVNLNQNNDSTKK
ncbi:UDP-N-acetylmuramoyl-L-alanine--D-glutamate ligase [bacterium]|jgi:UDP-N-acetylmuramoylalanine--D-glutamate ligase|nr:UDP-N-acetylmuramoyl-L-alanine--D-glutamate ligase [bacterium]MDP6571645.1 UDP-N-acetylmuramoyl-L-alanine--D-glutamate ligase [Patescibacteria group bacterium]MDP6756164.1 UDP-N-acetylmuramoyl-L-alanine--D-glutamate ligase [Patescibacteria group bacterium]|tara:strand:- start:56755 stop:58161 length:1407 start_codon:yes stop_codon:yes gene_type:complete